MIAPYIAEIRIMDDERTPIIIFGIIALIARYI